MSTLTTEASGMEMASAFISGMALVIIIVVLTLIIRSNRQEQALEMWISREFSRLHESYEMLRNQILVLQQQMSSQGYVQQLGQQGSLPSSSSSRNGLSGQQAYQYTQQSPYTQYMPDMRAPVDKPPELPFKASDRAERVTDQSRAASEKASELRRSTIDKKRTEPSSPRERAYPAEVKLVMRLINEQTNNGMPFQMDEMLSRATPRMNVIKLAPRMNNGWSSAMLLDNSGDMFYALADNIQAFLFPTDERFSATVDPKQFFDGARSDSRLHAIHKPGILSKTSDGSWQLVEKGRVDMR